MRLELTVLGSSSKGNGYVVQTDDGYLIIECGVKFTEVEKAIDFDISKIVGCLLSHEHQDHSKYASEYIKRGVNVYSEKRTLEKIGLSGIRAIPIESRKKFSFSGFTVLPFDVQHDAVAPLGFLIQHNEFGKLLFATDTYYVKYVFKNINYIMVECNYSTEIIQKRLQKGEIHKALYNRLFTSHFSLENVEKFIRANLSGCLSGIYLMHLSDGNSDAKLFRERIEKASGVPTEIC